ncbi:MAG: tagaturonate epimerase family protein [Anaerolineae bacterium]
MEHLERILAGAGLQLPLPEAAGRDLALWLGSRGAGQVYPRSLTAQDGVLYFLAKRGAERVLGIVAPAGQLPSGFVGQAGPLAGAVGLLLWQGPADHANAEALRRALPFAAPRTVGLARSVGCGDRLGLATSGHIRALRGSGWAAILAQQSIRELQRTQRMPEQVLDAATWGVLQEGWREGYGADADHLKTTADADLCLQAGYTFFTVDPGEHVDNAVDAVAGSALEEKVAALPWDVLESSPRALQTSYAGRRLVLRSGRTLTMEAGDLLRAAAKYGRAVAHAVRVYRHLRARSGGRPFELEVSVDETATPTRVVEHWFIAKELRRLGVQWVSLAPRFGGRFEKGVDYIGDLSALEAELAWHADLARTLGPYKLSLHSGSDKFSVYSLLHRQAGPLVHLKTAGTSYLEALRACARVDPDLFREILAFARERYPQDRASYHVSAKAARVAVPESVRDADLPAVLDQFDTRQALHVTFGSVLTERAADGTYRFRDRLLTALEAHEEEHYAALEAHMRRHLAPFIE